MSNTFDNRIKKNTFIAFFVDEINFELDEESPDEEYYGQEEKSELQNFVFEQPYTQNKIIHLIELFRKYRVCICYNKYLPP